MNKEMRARSVHPSRHYGYTHHDAHAAILSKSMRRSRSTFEAVIRPRLDRQLGALGETGCERIFEDHASGDARPVGAEALGECGRSPRHGVVRGDTDLPGGIEISQHARFSCVVSRHGDW